MGISLALICFTYLCLYRIRYGVYCVILLLPTYLIRFSLFGVPMTFLEAMILILGFTWLYSVYIENKSIFKNFRQYLLFQFSYITGFYYKNHNKILSKVSLINADFSSIRLVVWFFIFAGFLGVFIAPDWLAGAGIFKAYILEPIIFFVVMIGVVHERRDVMRICIALGLSVVVISLSGILQYFTGVDLLLENTQGVVVRRITSVFEYPNAIGLYFAPIIGLFGVLFLNSVFFDYKKKWRIIVLSFFVIMLGFIGMFLARSEAAIIACGFVLAIYCLFYNSFTRRLVILFGLTAFMLLSSVHAFNDVIADKVMLRDFSGEIRRNMYGETFDMLKSHVIFGAGLSGYQEVMEPYHAGAYTIGGMWQPVEIYFYPHTILFNFWSELGLLGLISIFSLICICCYVSLRNYGGVWSSAFFVMISIWAIHGLVDVPFFKNDLAVLFWIIIAFSFFGRSFDRIKD